MEYESLITRLPKIKEESALRFCQVAKAIFSLNMTNKSKNKPHELGIHYPNKFFATVFLYHDPCSFDPPMPLLNYTCFSQ